MRTIPHYYIVYYTTFCSKFLALQFAWCYSGQYELKSGALPARGVDSPRTEGLRSPHGGFHFPARGKQLPRTGVRGKRKKSKS
jgi:hypothetical protein